MRGFLRLIGYLFLVALLFQEEQRRGTTPLLTLFDQCCTDGILFDINHSRPEMFFVQWR